LSHRQLLVVVIDNFVDLRHHLHGHLEGFQQHPEQARRSDGLLILGRRQQAPLSQWHLHSRQLDRSPREQLMNFFELLRSPERGQRIEQRVRFLDGVGQQSEVEPQLVEGVYGR
jgi:hypothetical protein